MLRLSRVLCAGLLLSSFSAFAGSKEQISIAPIEQMQVTARAGNGYPIGPDLSETPGKRCDHPDSVRYPERIPYCTRSVDSGTKWEVIRTYDDKLGYRIEAIGRVHFKIDHYIPLCMGGSNDKANIWPQHESVYAQTDPLEGLACEKMAQGVLLQAKAIELIRKAKNDLSQVQATLQYLRSL